VEVAEVVLAEHGKGPGRLHTSGGEGTGAQLCPLDDPHLGHAGDPRPMAGLPRPQQDGDVLTVCGGQFPDDPDRKGVVTAHDKMVAAGREPGDGGTA